MAFKYYDLSALGSINDLISTALTPQYPLGKIVSIENDRARDSEFLLEFIYIKNSALSPMEAFVPIVITESYIRNAEVFGTQTPVLENEPIILIGVPQIEIPFDSYGFVQITGNAQASVQGNIGDNTGLKLAADLPTGFKATTSNRQRIGKTIGDILSGGNIEVIQVLLFGRKVEIPAN